MNRHYRYGFLSDDHVRLADMLKQTPHQWVLSYGDHPEIWRLCAWARIEAITDRELVITRPTH
jgi:site-specific DNA-adenine methylase